MNSLRRLLFHDWPLHVVLRAMDPLPDNVLVFRMRGWLAKRFLGSAGADLRIGPYVSIHNPAQVHVGNHVYLAHGCKFIAMESIRLGDEVQFGPYCVVVSAEHTRQNRSFRYGPARASPVEVGKGAWVAAHVTLTAGATVGEGALVAAGAVVSSEVPPDAVVGGVPARFIRSLSDDE